MSTESLEEYINIQTQLEKVGKQLERSNGRLEMLKERLTRDFHVSTQEKGKNLLKSIQQKITSLEKDLAKAKDKFNTKWGDKLDGA